jgi:hypothetical protein
VDINASEVGGDIFALDRIAATDNSFAFALNDTHNKAERFEWWLQGFKKQNKSNSNNAHTGYVKTDIDKLKKQIKAYPKSSRLQSSLGYSKKSDAKTFESNIKKGCYINTFSLKNWLKSPSVKDALLEGMVDEILSEFDFGDIEPDNLVEFPTTCT